MRKNIIETCGTHFLSKIILFFAYQFWTPVYFQLLKKKQQIGIFAKQN